MIILTILIIMSLFIMLWMFCGLLYIGCDMKEENVESMTTLGKIVYHIARLH